MLSDTDLISDRQKDPFPEISSRTTLDSEVVEIEPAADQTLPDVTEPLIRSENIKPAETQTADLHEQLQHLEINERIKSSSCLSQSCPSCSQDPPLDVSILPRAASLPTMKLQSSFEEFTPGFCGDPDDETCWFQCSGPGRYQCRVSGLVFDMTGGGDVFYRVVPWNRSLLGPHGKKPAGPLFDISCQQRSVARLHLPHCEVRSTGRCHFLSVAHLHDEGVEFIRPERITETHIVISITGFSAFGNVKDEDSPPDPVRALVLLFYKPPADPDVTSFLNLLLLPGNVVIRDLKRSRKKLFGLETFIDAPPHCKLRPEETYSLSTSPAGESVLVQPTEAEFDPESYSSYFTSIQVIFSSITGNIKLSVKEKETSCCAWERRVCLLAHRVKPGLPSDEQLKETRTRIIDGISEPVLQSLLDKLLEKKVLSDSEREAVEAEKVRGDKGRVLVDTVRRKGAAASSEMIRFLCELDPFLCKHVGLICEKVEPNQ
ncbi:PREDICTED: NACHT, LRR and PYD domains-containing protein 1-like [Poecilia mexicana]|uniref:NACHT, LRR and PYD domains-containing protein 1-like n=1 Tax=Poecilia mexicana TaxID=48701 RepID=UPI00072E50BB|nr:PREDICTED: NACHT, LRR and PYD domains-containing protein 1-like [Poecilia mexicana]